MPHDPVRAADTRAWIQKAADDIRAAEVDQLAVPPLRGDAVFHCQQAVEKAFKALLSWHDLPFRKTHSLEELGEACLALDPSLRALVDRAAPLTQYAWKYRYPGDAEEPTADRSTPRFSLPRIRWRRFVVGWPHSVVWRLTCRSRKDSKHAIVRAGSTSSG